MTLTNRASTFVLRSIAGCMTAFAASLPCAAQTASLSDLETIVVEAEIRHIQVAQRGGNQAELAVTQRWSLSIAKDRTITVKVETSGRGGRSQQNAQARSATFELNGIQRLPSMGGGDAVWLFDDGTLTFLRTFRSGALRVRFAFSRTIAGLTCKASIVFARENGTRPIQLVGPDGGLRTLVGTKQTFSTCRARKAHS